jgi:ankyrin repeat protein
MTNKCTTTGGDVNKCGNDGQSPILMAALNGHAECLKLLLAAGGDVNKCDNNGSSPILMAALNGHAECLKLLLAAGGDVNKCDNNGSSPIYVAAQKGHAEFLKLLLAAGGDVNKCDNDGASPIYVAAEKGHAECLKLLLAAGGDVNKCGNDGQSPILMAALNGHAECLKLLLAAGGDVNKCDKNGRSPILLLMDAGGDVGDVNKCDNDGRSPILFAAQKGHAECLKLLLAAGGDVNKCDNYGRSPIYVAAQKGHAECLKLLLAAGGDVGDVNKCHKNNFSPIYVAAQNGHAECLKLLLDAGGDANESCIFIAGLFTRNKKGHAECLKLLLEPADAEHSAVAELHRAAGKIVINRHRGFGKLSADYVMQFSNFNTSNFNTFAADVMLLGGCFYFELEVVDVGKYLQFGLCMQGFEQSRWPKGQGVGDDQYSWAVDGDRSLKWHNGSTNYGSTWAVGDVIGFAVDMRSQAAAVMSISVNGSFAAPNGIAFDNIAAPYLTPAFSATSGRYRVNFGDRPFAYAPIGEQYMSVHAFHKQNQQK